MEFLCKALEFHRPNPAIILENPTLKCWKSSNNSSVCSAKSTVDNSSEAISSAGFPTLPTLGRMMESNRGLRTGIPGLPALESIVTNFPTYDIEHALPCYANARAACHIMLVG